MKEFAGIDVLNVDFDRETGVNLVGWPAVAQNIREGFLTDFGVRIMREYYGSLVPRALGQSVTEETMLALTASISAFLEVYEPRFSVVQAIPQSITRLGFVKINITGEYLPRALLGDTASTGLRQVGVSLGQTIEVA